MGVVNYLKCKNPTVQLHQFYSYQISHLPVKENSGKTNLKPNALLCTVGCECVTMGFAVENRGVTGYLGPRLGRARTEGAP
jgi:hypothetical protein